MNRRFASLRICFVFLVLFLDSGKTCLSEQLDDSKEGSAPINVLLVDGQNNYHDWKVTTPILKQHLLASGRFTVDVATTPPKKHDMSSFQPQFSDYDVVLVRSSSKCRVIGASVAILARRSKQANLHDSSMQTNAARSRRNPP